VRDLALAQEPPAARIAVAFISDDALRSGARMPEGLVYAGPDKKQAKAKRAHPDHREFSELAQTVRVRCTVDVLGGNASSSQSKRPHCPRSDLP
jgi:hypothetical protein